MFSSAGCSLLRAEGFSCSLDVLNEGLGKGKLQFLNLKILKNFFSCEFFFQFLVFEILDPDRYSA
jgi:hypothetical protein